MSSEIPLVRAVRADEWRAVKQLRLDALRDPVAHLAFLETYEQAVARPDAFWRERTERCSADGAAGARQFVAEGADGEWGGSLTVLVEEAGSVDWAGFPVEVRQGHVVGVFVRPEWRGLGVSEGLLRAGVEWAWGMGLERVRLIVHEENLRAQGLYRKVGFRPSGVTVPLQGSGGEASELEFVLGRPSEG
ncbi:GNAT family N-acetyltransferase [Streptomyces sp. B93]|uniref:GNAT family N-acetyltransferase n=1 Tax=Streptomyces sp. B93 TaxID=2824875 RepID=UPI001B35C0ED|nr:GNAT family N-acetyltransferase [Streptomyces sp. B93]MBQ1094095.1 N-acetyltransferase [Streptomyces sp. B93]